MLLYAQLADRSFSIFFLNDRKTKRFPLCPREYLEES